MRKNDNPDLEKVGLQLDLVIAKGFDCHVCSSKRFRYNGMGLVFCEECGIAYEINTLEAIYNK